MSSLNDYLEQHPELEDLTEEQLIEHLDEADARAEAEFDAQKEQEL